MSKYRARFWKEVKAVTAIVVGLTLASLLNYIIPAVVALIIGIVSGLIIYRRLPDSSAKTAKQELNELPSREKIQREMENIESNDPEVIAKRLSFVEPEHVADALSVLDIGANKLTVEQLTHISYILMAGIQLPGDKQQVLAQLERTASTDSIETLLYERLFELYDNAEPGFFSKKVQKGKFAVIKANTATVLSPDETQERIQNSNYVEQGTDAKQFAMSAIMSFSRLVAPPREYRSRLADVITNAERGQTRGAAAVALGGIGRKYPDLGESVTEEIRPLVNDESRICRQLAVEALAGPAIHTKAAEDLLRSIIEGTKREFELDTDLRQKAQEVLEEYDPYSYQSTSTREPTGESSDQDDLTI